MTTETRRYTNVAALLHWIIALLVLSNFAVAWRMEGLKGVAQFEAYQWHKSIGITVLLLTLLRIVWRLTHRPPPYEATLKAWEQTLARITHSVFYVLLVAIPVAGWIMVSASKYNIPTLLYGVIPWPHIAPIHGADMAARTRIAEVANGMHENLAFAMLVLAGLHIAGALKHQFLDGDGTFMRMIPGRRGA